MFGLYIFSLVVGGAFLLLSLFGDAFDSDIDGLDADLDVDVASVDGSGLWEILSLRSLVYSLFGFGAVGTALSLIGINSALYTLFVAAAAGVLSGALVSWAFALVKRSEAGPRNSDTDFEGLLADVTVPLGNEGTGQIAVSRGGRRHVLLARPHDSAHESSPEDWTRVLVVELVGGVARVTPAGPDLLEASQELE